jgi:uncharacterized protein YdeI (YjbR/CyaY-like superfamily)
MTTNTLYVNNRKDWREWLEKNHATSKEIWLIYYKKHSGKSRIPYDDAVEEALCFGWIDSIIKKIDDEKYAQKFTPRKENSMWSESNKKRVNLMIGQGKMTKAGLALIRVAKKNGKWNEVFPREEFSEIPGELKIVLEKNKKARENFHALAPSYKKQYIGWIVTAKRPETREKRLQEAIILLEKNQKLGMK